MVPVRYRPNAARLKVKHYVSVHLAQIEGCGLRDYIDMDMGVIQAYYSTSPLLPINNVAYKLSSFSDSV